MNQKKRDDYKNYLQQVLSNNIKKVDQNKLSKALRYFEGESKSPLALNTTIFHVEKPTRSGSKIIENALLELEKLENKLSMNYLKGGYLKGGYLKRSDGYMKRTYMKRTYMKHSSDHKAITMESPTPEFTSQQVAFLLLTQNLECPNKLLMGFYPNSSGQKDRNQVALYLTFKVSIKVDGTLDRTSVAFELLLQLLKGVDSKYSSQPIASISIPAKVAILETLQLRGVNKTELLNLLKEIPSDQVKHKYFIELDRELNTTPSLSPIRSML
jgi:hypothetical protein